MYVNKLSFAELIIGRYFDISDHRGNRKDYIKIPTIHEKIARMPNYIEKNALCLTNMEFVFIKSDRIIIFYDE